MARSPISPEMLVRALGAYAPTPGTIAGGAQLRLSLGAQSMTVVWADASSGAEFDFFVQDEPYYSDWLEYANAESPEFQVADLVRIADGFFMHETRIAPVVRFGGARQLQYFAGGRWLNTFFPSMDDDET